MSVMATGTVDGADEPSLARDMIDVHGPRAAVARRGPQAKFWIRVLGLIQQRGADKDERPGVQG